MQSNSDDKIVADYQAKADAVIKSMLQIVTRAQRKVDDSSYRKILQKIEGQKK